MLNQQIDLFASILSLLSAIHVIKVWLIQACRTIVDSNCTDLNILIRNFHFEEIPNWAAQVCIGWH